MKKLREKLRIDKILLIKNYNFLYFNKKTSL